MDSRTRSLHRSHEIRILPASLMVSLSQVKESKGRFVPLWVLVRRPNHTEEGHRAGPQRPRRPSSRALPAVAAVAGKAPAGLQLDGSARKPDLQRGQAWPGAGWEPPEHPGRLLAPALRGLPGTPSCNNTGRGVLVAGTEPDTQRRGELSSEREGERFSTVHWTSSRGFICGGECGGRRMDQPVETELSDQAPYGPRQVAGSELESPAGSPGRFGTSSVLPPRPGAVFYKWPTFVLS